MTNIDLFKYFLEYCVTTNSYTICPILGPVNFAMWIKQKDVGYTDNMMPRVREMLEHINKLVDDLNIPSS